MKSPEESNSRPLHRPVMLEETLRCLAPRPGEVMVDGTVGTAGHAVEILKRLRPGGLLVGIDRDREALGEAERRLQAVGGKYRLFHGFYTQIGEFLRLPGKTPEGALDGVLLDLGASSVQLDRPERGFSFRHDGPLSMRMDASAGESAAELLERVSVEELEDVLRRYGEERAARRIAHAIDRFRKGQRIETTGQLARIVEKVLPRKGRRIHPATRTFQALRIAVNRELEYLRLALRDMDRFVQPGGRVVVLSYHSLEDREVKRILGGRVKDGIYRWLFKGVLRASREEVDENPRSRSAKLRAVVRAGQSTH